MRHFNIVHLMVVLMTATMASCKESEEEYPESSSQETSLEYQIQNAEYRILAIGNSFLEDATRHLPRLMKEQKESSVLFCRLHKNSSSLKDHWNNLQNDEPCYELYYACNGSWYQKDEKVNINQAIAMADWDAVTFQQLSNYSGMPDSYIPYLPNLIEIVQKKPKKPKIVWHQTWSYSSNYTFSAFANYDYDQDKMTAAINEACDLHKDRFDILIPSGSLIKSLRESQYNNEDDLTSDGRHLDKGLPCYALSCLWHEKLIKPITGKTSLGSRFRPSTGTIKVTQESASYAFLLIDSLINQR